MSPRRFAFLVSSLVVGCGPAKPTEAAKPAAEVAAPSPPAKPDAPPAAAPSPPAETQDVVLWHAYRGTEKAALELAVAKLNTSQTAVRVKPQAVPYDPFVDKITITIPRGQGPDLFIFHHNMVGAWVEDDLLEPLGERVPPARLNELLPRTVTALVYEKNLYGLPLAFKSLVLFCDKSRLPEPPATMEALLAAVKPLQDPTQGRYGFVYDASRLYHHAPWLHAFGGAVFDADHKLSLDSEGARQSLAFARELFATHKVMPDGIDGFMVTSLFNEGKAVCVLQGPWFLAEVGAGTEFIARSIPTVQGKTPRPYLGVEAVFISRRSEKKEAALQAALFLIGAEAAKIRVETGRQPVAHAEALAEAARRDPVIQVFVDQMANSELMDSSPEIQLVWAAADTALSQAIFRGVAPAQALGEAQARIAADIAKRGK
jgi:arabinogalactan oligomer/maltooligosaccharide transport system substrate-binding protein